MSHFNFNKDLGVKGHRCGSEIGKEYSANSTNSFHLVKILHFLLANTTHCPKVEMFVFISQQTGMWVDPKN